MKAYDYCIYFTSNKVHDGVTNDLHQRVTEHKTGNK